jgi:hypothetical protein
MVITSVPYIRRKLFELFFYVHILFAVAMTACAFFHSGKLVPILVALTWGVDLIIRKLMMAAARYPKKTRIRIISSTVVELRFPKMNGFDFNPGQYCYLCIPQLGLLDWHPFSISSSPGQKIVSFHIRKAGAWTSALHNLAHTKDEVSILLGGPFGSVGVDLTGDRYRSVLLVSGGIGITPMQSICNQLVYEHSMGKRTLKTLMFVWMERDPMVMSDVDVVRRTGDIHLNRIGNTGAMDAMSAHDDDDGPLDLASTILGIFPPPASKYDNIVVVDPNSTNRAAEPPANISSLLSDEPTLMQQGKPDDDTFLGAAFRGSATRSPIDVLDMQVYLTSKDETSGVGDLPFVHQGRPDIEATFQNLKQKAVVAGETSRVAVCVCAPLNIVNICQNACIKFSDDGVRFDFHAETFG